MTETERDADGAIARVGRAVEAGFTLLEIMVVLAIIALLAGGVGAAVFRNFKKAQISTARLRVKAVRDATSQYMIDNSSNCPRGVDNLVSQKYLDRNNAKDPWGKDFDLPLPGDQRHRQRRHLVGRPRQAGRDPGRRQVLGDVAPAPPEGLPNDLDATA